MRWRDAVLDALRRCSRRHQSKVIDRDALIREEMDRIKESTGSIGQTPSQTLSRVLQELRDEGVIEFLSPGSYLLLAEPFDVESEELPEAAIDMAIRAGRLRLGVVDASDERAMLRRRLGQSRLRELTMANYGRRCSVCDVVDTALLVASHVVRWADSPDDRGKLTNVLCLCRFHDALFETGYWTLTDELVPLTRSDSKSDTIRFLLGQIRDFRRPASHLPDPSFVARHRVRTGLDEQAR